VPNYKPYNPLDKKNLGRSISHALTDQPALALGRLKPFIGAGVYMIYYVGDFEPYAHVAALNIDDKFEFPIYVGKAVPSGSRRGVYATPKARLFAADSVDHISHPIA